MKFRIFLFFTLLSTNVCANGYLSNGPDSTIKWINLEPTVIRIAFDSPTKRNPDSCGSVGAVLMKQESDYEKAMYSSLLAAMHSGKKVKFYGAGCLSGWGTTYPKVKAVYIYN